MAANEVGIVKEAADNRGGRGFTTSTVTVEVKGVSRVCWIDEASSDQLLPGMHVSLIYAQRKF